MSTFIMNSISIAQLAEYISALNYVGYDFFGYSIPESLNNALNLTRTADEKKIFNALYALNVKAVNGRYNDNTPDTTEMPKEYKTIFHVKAWDGKNSTYKIEPWHYQLLKRLQCFIYQCTEDATINDPLYKALKDLEHTIIYFIVTNSPEYSAAIWG